MYVSVSFCGGPSFWSLQELSLLSSPSRLMPALWTVEAQAPRSWPRVAGQHISWQVSASSLAQGGWKGTNKTLSKQGITMGISINMSQHVSTFYIYIYVDIQTLHALSQVCVSIHGKTGKGQCVSKHVYTCNAHAYTCACLHMLVCIRLCGCIGILFSLSKTGMNLRVFLCCLIKV